MEHKVLFITPNLAGGGAERVILTLANEFSQMKDIETSLMILNFTGPYIKDIKETLNIVTLNRILRFDKSLIGTAKIMINKINAIRPTVILTTLSKLNLLILAIKPFLKGNPKVVVRETNPPSPRWYGRKNQIFNRMYKVLYPKADKIIAISNAVRKDLIGYIEKDKIKDKISVIYNPINTKLIQHEANKRPNSEWLSRKRKYNVISVGRLSVQKDYPTLLKAMQIVSQQVNCQLTILGEGEEYDNLMNLTKDLGINGQVHFLGFVDNPYFYIKESDLFVLSSKWEGFGLVLAEAMAVGTPVIATNCNGAPQEILDNGNYGALVDVGDSESMAKEILNHLFLDYASKSASYRYQEFDVKNITRLYLTELLDAPSS